MIKINDIEIRDYKINTLITPLIKIINNQKINIETPYISIEYDNKIIDIEIILSINELSEIKKKIDFKKYITEIKFIEDGILYHHIKDIEKSTIEKINKKEYKIYIKGNKEDFTFVFDEIINI